MDPQVISEIVYEVPVACRTGRSDPRTVHGGSERSSCPCLPRTVAGCQLPQAWLAAPEEQEPGVEVTPSVDGVTPVCTSLWVAE